jgi:hypothetical protein
LDARASCAAGQPKPGPSQSSPTQELAPIPLETIARSITIQLHFIHCSKLLCTVERSWFPHEAAKHAVSQFAVGEFERRHEKSQEFSGQTNSPTQSLLRQWKKLPKIEPRFGFGYLLFEATCWLLLCH